MGWYTEILRTVVHWQQDNESHCEILLDSDRNQSPHMTGAINCFASIFGSATLPTVPPRLGKIWMMQSMGWKPSGARFNIKMPSYQYRKSHCGDYKNPLHLDVVDRYLRRMGDKTIPDEALPSLESFYPPWVAGIDLPQSRCCGFFVSFTNKHK